MSRNLHPRIDIEFIKEALAEIGHTVRNVMNTRHRVNKIPLPLYFFDLEPTGSNKLNKTYGL